MAFDPIKATGTRIARTEAYAEMVRKLFAQTANELIGLVSTIPDLNSGIMYSFDAESRKTQAKVEKILRRLHSLVVMSITKGIEQEWERANLDCDKLLLSAYGRSLLNSPIMKGWQARNLHALVMFINRSDGDMNLSKRVWKSVRQLRDEMEVAISAAIGQGRSAQEMSRDIRQYLNDPDLMFRRFRYKVQEPVYDDEGNPVFKNGKQVMKDKIGPDGKVVYSRKWKKRIQDPARPGKYRFIDYDRDSYIPKGAGGSSRGVYKSAAKNAMRVARTETNIAYRRADHIRWQKLDFVIGQRVRLSRNHPTYDICDQLAGDYPKSFVFDGWHPQCFCYVTPILIDADEMAKANAAFAKGEVYEPKADRVTKYPAGFKNWCRENAEKIERARAIGKEPYFVKNNSDVVDRFMGDD